MDSPTDGQCVPLECRFQRVILIIDSTWDQRRRFES